MAGQLLPHPNSPPSFSFRVSLEEASSRHASQLPLPGQPAQEACLERSWLQPSAQGRPHCERATCTKRGPRHTCPGPYGSYLGQVFHDTHHHRLQRWHLHQRKALLQEVFQFLVPAKSCMTEKAAQDLIRSSCLPVPRRRTATRMSLHLAGRDVYPRGHKVLLCEFPGPHGGCHPPTHLSSAFPSEAMPDTRSRSLSRSSSNTDWWNSNRGVPCRSKKGRADCRDGSSTPFSV